jgi:prepilin-type N-terminal cleavage/methylation domain-containing protein
MDFPLHHNNRSGFSLVELMVALSLFSIIMTVSMGTLLILIDANAKAQAISSAMTNLTFALDSMTRNLRTGRNFYCTNAGSLSGALPTSVSNCTGNTAIVFTPGYESSTRIAYRFNSSSSTIEQRIDRNSVQGQWVPLTSDKPPIQVAIQTLRFTVEGAQDTEAGNYVQPRVTLLIDGSVLNGLSGSTPFQVQSRVTQRVLNY